MGLFNDKIDYENYENSIIKNDEQINNDIVIADGENYNYTFDSETPISSIINQLPGYKAKVTYFNKTQGNQELYEYPDLTLDDIIVEYTKIENLTIYMDSPIDVTDLDNYEGEGYITAGLEPMPGDFILMPLYDKRLGLFVVTTTSATTYNFTRIFKVNFKFYMFPNQEDLDKIYGNVNKELVADDSLNNTHQELLYDKDRYTVLRRIGELIRKYKKIWENRIITVNNNYTISYFDAENNIYVGDIFMERYVTSMFGLTDIKKVNLFNARDDRLTILDIILDKDTSRWNLNKKYKTIFVYDELMNPFLKRFMYNQIDYFVDVDNDEDNEYYILSKEFYDAIFTDEEDITLNNNLELGLYSLIENLDIPLDNFNGLIDEIDEIIRVNDNRKIFYYIPLAIAVMKYFKYVHNYPDKFLY